MMSIIKNNLITFALYYLATLIILSLMYEQSQAILVWPAVGVGIITALVWGWSVLPGLYIAQLAISFHLSGKPFDEFISNGIFFTQLLIFLGIIRCYLGAFLIKYFVGYPNALISIKAIFNFFFIVGPLATLASTTLFNVVRYSFGYLDYSVFLVYFFDWWFGDILGFMIFAPLTMVLISQPKSIWKPRIITFALPVIIIFLVVIFLFNRTQIIEVQSLEQNLNIKSELVASKVQQKLDKTNHFLSNVSYLFDNGNDFLNQFHRYIPTNANEADAFVWSINNGIEHSVSSNHYQPINFLRLKQADLGVFFGDVQESNLVTRYIEELTAFVTLLKLNSSQNSIKIYAVNDAQSYLNSLIDPFDLLGVNIHLQLDSQTSYQLIDSGGTFSRTSKLSEISSVITVNKNRWNLLFKPTSIYLLQNKLESNSLIAKISLFFTGLIGIMLLVISGKTTLTDIEVKKRTLELDIKSQQINKSKKQYQNLVEQHPVVLWRLDVEKRKMIYISQKVAYMFGYPHRHWLNRPDFWLKSIHADDQEKVIQAIERAIATKKNFELEYRLIKSNRNIAWINDVINVVTEKGEVTELVGLMIDVTEIYVAREQQGISENRYKALFKRSFDPLVLIDPTSKKLIDVNEKAKQLFGIKNDYEDLSLANFVPKQQTNGSDSERALYKYISAAKINNHASFILQMKNAKNAIITVQIDMNKLGGFEKDLLLVSIRDVTEKHQYENKIKQLAYYDNLTGLPNREYFYTKFEFYFKKANSLRQFGSIIFLDLDRFKILNDSLGHQAGDQLLQMVAKRIQKVSGEKDFCARLSGDEFIILTTDFDSDSNNVLESTLVKCELLLESLNEPYTIGNYEHLITPSIGVSLFPSKKATIDEIIHQADTAMYSSKAKGKNTITVYRDDMDRPVSQRLEFEKGIRLAFENNEFELHYQPQVDENSKIEGVEALLRWRKLRKYGKNIEELIETIEEIGLTHELLNWVFDKACSQLKIWKKLNRPIQSIAINVTAKQFHKNSFVEHVKSIIDGYELDPNHIILELTEQAIIEDVNGLIHKLEILERYGVRTSLDDFGTGYSSLAYLKQLPIHQLKIDKMFIKDIIEEKNSQHIVQAIINLAQMMEIELVAEGIETDVHFNLLKSLGCKQFQGYYFSRPLPENELFMRRF